MNNHKNIHMADTQILSDFVYLDVWRDTENVPYYFVMQKIAEPNIFDRQAIFIDGMKPEVKLTDDKKTVAKIVVGKDTTVYYPAMETERAKDLVKVLD